jgi:uncharacterized protein (TIGR03546 family)
MWEPFIKLFKLINSEQEPHQVSLGLSFGMIAGFTPTFSMHNLVVLFLLLMIRANISAFIAGYVLFSLLAFALDPAFHSLGNTILHMPSLQPTFTEMYNNTFWRLTNFNNTVLMGSLVVSVVAFVPAFLLGNFLIRNYRSRIQARFANTSRRLNKFLKFGSLFGRFSEGG